MTVFPIKPWANNFGLHLWSVDAFRMIPKIRLVPSGSITE
jgi:hypothetical protein